ncbi:hypothetical protein BWO91_17350 [Plantibacter flavus]|uniref:hypothetical protein n=1 Tax=Plantibacter flavus TaxID=150123 RepID=UPI00099CE289|nr:hypothetical protein [Plantibacter flavus]AQX81493.1 hypothetical protein BWO91_17350 [Plantibacter flavus]
MTRVAHLLEVVAKQAEEADRLGRTASSNSARGHLVTIAGACHTIALLTEIDVADDDRTEFCETLETFIRCNVDLLAREIEEQQERVHEDRANRQAPHTRCTATMSGHAESIRCDRAARHDEMHLSRRYAVVWS